MKPLLPRRPAFLPFIILLVFPLAASAQTIYPIKLNPPLVEGGNVFRTLITADGTRVVYLADQEVDDQIELFSVPISGGAAVKLNSEFLFPDAGVVDFQISPDSNHVIYQADQDLDGVLELYSVPVSGGVAVKLNPPLGADRRVSLFSFQISPDSSRVVYLADQDVNDRIELYSVPIAGGVVERLNHQFFFDADVLSFQISPDSSRVVYHSETLGTQEALHSVPIGGGAAVQLNPALPAGGEIDPDYKISAQSSTVVYQADQDVLDEIEIFSVPIGGGVTTQLNHQLGAGSVVFGFDIDSAGSRVVFTVVGDIPQTNLLELYSVPIGGGGVAQLNTSGVGEGIITFRISPDGSRVVYVADHDAVIGRELYSVPIGGGSPIVLSKPLIEFGNVNLSALPFSPDGSRVLYNADQEVDQQNELFSVPTGGGTPVKLNSPLARVPSGPIIASPDSSRVVFAERVGEILDLYCVPIAGGQAVKLIPTRADHSVVSASFFHPDSSRFVYIRDQEVVGRKELYVTSAQAVWQSVGGNWSTPANWRNGVVPSSITEALLVEPAVTRLSSPDSAAVAESLVLGGGAGTSVLELLDSTALSLPRGAKVLPGGVLRGDGVLALGALPLDLPAGGAIEAGPGEEFHVQSGAVSNAGSIEVSGRSPAPAELRIDAPVHNLADTGSISGSEAILRFPMGLENDGSLSFGGGFNEVRGDVDNKSTGRVTVSGGAIAIFHEDVNNVGGFNVSASGGLQSSAVFFGALTGNGISGGGHVFIEGDARPGFSPGTMAFGGDLSYGFFAALELELAGPVAGSGHDQITVGGHLALGGTLIVTLLDGFVPSAGMTFDLWEANSVSGSFHSIDLPALPLGLFWHTAEVSTTGELRVGLTPESYSEFAAHYGLLTGPEGDEEGDGLSNLLEYLSAHHPLQNDGAGAHAEFIQDSSLNQFSVPLANPVGRDLLTAIETSTTLRSQDWEVIATRTGNEPWTGPANVAVTPLADGRETVTATQPTSGDPRRFYRLRAQLAP